MPVIRGDAVVSVITAEKRKKVIEQLTRELRGEITPQGPVIFEIPLEESDRFDVLVVWDAWKPFPSQDRSNIILEAYKRKKTQIAQALGVTYQEAVEQQVLPYAVSPMARPGEVDIEELKKAMIAEGGIISPESGKVELRFPTMSLAERTHRRLADQFPRGYWSIVQTVAQLP